LKTFNGSKELNCLQNQHYFDIFQNLDRTIKQIEEVKTKFTLKNRSLEGVIVDLEKQVEAERQALIHNRDIQTHHSINVKEDQILDDMPEKVRKVGRFKK
jgi:hypothetical protein